MKRGDLVKLVLPGNYVGWHGKVVVSWVHPVVRHPAIDYLRDKTPSKFPEGTLAVFLSDEAGGSAPASRILIEGRVGWVWSMYLEAL